MRKQSGQTLLEILLAFSVAILVLGSIVFGVTTSLSNAQYTKNQGLATSFATEGMTVVRKIRDSSWNNISSLADFTNNEKYCLDKNLHFTEIPVGQNCDGSTYGLGDSGIFSREVRFEHNKSECCPSSGCSSGSVVTSRVTVKVSWADNKCPAGASNPLCHSVQLISCFSNIDSKQMP